MVESLGANEVVDYTKHAFTRGENGAFVTTQARRAETAEELSAIRELLEAGALWAAIDRRYTL